MCTGTSREAPTPERPAIAKNILLLRTFCRVEFLFGTEAVLVPAAVVRADEPPREAEAARPPHRASWVWGEMRAQVPLLGEFGRVVGSALR